MTTAFFFMKNIIIIIIIINRRRVVELHGTERKEEDELAVISFLLFQESSMLLQMSGVVWSILWSTTGWWSSLWSPASCHAHPFQYLNLSRTLWNSLFSLLSLSLSLSLDLIFFFLCSPFLPSWHTFQCLLLLRSPYGIISLALMPRGRPAKGRASSKAQPAVKASHEAGRWWGFCVILLLLLLLLLLLEILVFCCCCCC